VGAGLVQRASAGTIARPFSSGVVPHDRWPEPSRVAAGRTGRRPRAVPRYLFEARADAARADRGQDPHSRGAVKPALLIEEDSLNIEAYLERLNYRGSHGPTAATLRALHVAHLLAVPFENLSIRAKQPIVLDLEGTVSSDARAPCL
jgi:hypothetical protein